MGKKKVTITYLYGYLENWRKNQKEPFPNFGRCFSRFVFFSYYLSNILVSHLTFITS